MALVLGHVRAADTYSRCSQVWGSQGGPVGIVSEGCREGHQIFTFHFHPSPSTCTLSLLHVLPVVRVHRRWTGWASGEAAVLSCALLGGARCSSLSATRAFVSSLSKLIALDSGEIVCLSVLSEVYEYFCTTPWEKSHIRVESEYFLRMCPYL